MINYKVYPTKKDVAITLATDLAQILTQREHVKTTIALSGGSTPFVMLDALAEKYGAKINWQNVHFFWVDERCVEPTSAESNYKNTLDSLFSKIDIPEENIHRVRGEDDPEKEVARYNGEIDKFVNKSEGVSRFDIVLLGMGDDGHTASIFPPEIDLMQAKENALIGKNPYSGQTRITLSGIVINNAARIIFLVTGSAKADIFEKILKKQDGYLNYPAAHISSHEEQTVWYIDQEVLKQ